MAAWHKPLASPIGVIKPKRQVLRTLRDARGYMIALDDAHARRQHGQYAAKLLMEAAQRGGDVKLVTGQIRLALLMDGALDMTQTTAANRGRRKR